MKTAKIENLKAETYFRRVGGSRVLVRGSCNRFSKKYDCYAFTDVNHTVSLKKGTAVEIDFEF